MTKRPTTFIVFAVVLFGIGAAIFFHLQRQQKIEREFQNYKMNGIFEFNKRQFGNAVQEFVTALHFKPKDVEVRTLIVSAYKKSQSYDLAVKFILDSLKLLPENPALLTELGYVYLDWGKLDEATKVFQKLVDSKIDPLEGYDGLAEVEVKKKNYDEAIQYFKKSTPFLEILIDQKREKEKVARSFHRQALLTKEIGQIELAKQYFLRMLKLTPFDLNLHFELAQIYEYLKDKEKAEHYYSAFLQIAGPLHQEKIEFARQRLEALKHGEFLPPPPVIPLK